MSFGMMASIVFGALLVMFTLAIWGDSILKKKHSNPSKDQSNAQLKKKSAIKYILILILLGAIFFRSCVQLPQLRQTALIKANQRADFYGLDVKKMKVQINEYDRGTILQLIYQINPQSEFRDLEIWMSTDSNAILKESHNVKVFDADQDMKTLTEVRGYFRQNLLQVAMAHRKSKHF